MVIPTFHYADAHAAIEFMETAFGFGRHAVHESEGGRVEHAELTVPGGGWIMLGSRREESPYDTGAQSVYVVVEDVDAHCERARAAGAVVFREPVDQDYGGRDYSARDPEGNVWSFGSYAPTE